MAHGIKETIPELLKTLRDLENELRSAAQNSVILRRDEAKRHLSDARRHLDALLGLAQRSDQKDASERTSSDDPSIPPSIKH